MKIMIYHRNIKDYIDYTGYDDVMILLKQFME